MGSHKVSISKRVPVSNCWIGLRAMRCKAGISCPRSRTASRFHSTCHCAYCFISTEGKPMVRINRVVTRGGDAGQTSLGDGARLRKDAPRIAAIGAVDEANAAVGVLRLATREMPDVDAML